jgi:hypothetical protein
VFGERGASGGEMAPCFGHGLEEIDIWMPGGTGEATRARRSNRVMRPLHEGRTKVGRNGRPIRLREPFYPFSPVSVRAAATFSVATLDLLTLTRFHVGSYR